MKLYICANASDPLRYEEVRACIDRLQKASGATVVMSCKDCELLYGHRDFGGFAEGCDYVVTIGGDGTVLRGAREAMKGNIPLLGINNGRLGYLCAVNIGDEETLSEEGIASLPVTERTLLSVTVAGQEHKALNDVVITKRSGGNSLQMNVCCRGETLARWRCDGVILSTPTGSTAYNASAGGPKLAYDLPGLVITPICPHHPTVGSIVVSDRHPITVNVTEEKEKSANVYADGVACGEILSTVTVKKAKETLLLLGRNGACSK